MNTPCNSYSLFTTTFQNSHSSGSRGEMIDPPTDTRKRGKRDIRSLSREFTNMYEFSNGKDDDGEDINDLVPLFCDPQPSYDVC